MTRRPAPLIALFTLAVGLVFACSTDGSEQLGTDSREAPASTSTIVSTADVFGHGVEADLGIYLREDISDQEMTALISRLLHETTPHREGEAMIEGILRVQGDYLVKAIFVDFRSSTSEARIEEVVALAQAEDDVVEVRRGAVVGA